MSGIRRLRLAADRDPDRDRGQTAVEFVGVFPYVLLLIMAVWECVVIGYGFALAGNAADEGARVGAVHGSAACGAAAREQISGAWGATVTCGESSGIYKASVRLQVPVFYPGFLDLDIEIPATGGSALEEDD